MDKIKRMTIAITLFGVIWLSVGCSSDSVGDVVEREVAEQLDARDTLPPIEEAAQNECMSLGVDLDAGTSIYIPDSWDSWCEGYLAASDNWNDLSQDDRYFLCTGFWETPDSQLLQEGMYEWGMTRDQTIGFVDFLWLTC